MAQEVTVTSPAIVAVTLRRKDAEMLTHSKARAIARVVKDSTATILRATVVGDDGSALGLSSATGSLYFHASTQDRTSVAYQEAATWTTDGSDGKIEFALTSNEVGTERTLRCEFEIQGYSGGNLVTEMFLLKIIERAAVAP